MCMNFNVMVNDDFDRLDTSCLKDYTIPQLLNLSETIYKFCFEYLFNEETQKNECPYCHSTHICKAGKNDKGVQRYKCQDCKRRFLNRTNRLTHWSHLTLEQWTILFHSALNNDHLSKTAKLVGISVVSTFYNKHKLLYVLNKLINSKCLKDKVELDETFMTYQSKGYENQHRHGISDDKIGIDCAIDEEGNYVLHVGDRGRAKSDTLIEVFKPYIEEGSIVVSDSERSYHRLMDALHVDWKKIESGQKEKDGYTLKRVNKLHDRIKAFFRGKRNVMTHYLQGYLALFQYIDLHPIVIGTQRFNQDFFLINRIYSGIRKKDICPGVNLYKTFYKMD